MALNIYIKDREPGVITIELDGNLDNSTYQLLEAELEKVLKTTPPVSTIILDFTKLEFISSMGPSCDCQNKVYAEINRREIIHGKCESSYPGSF